MCVAVDTDDSDAREPWLPRRALVVGVAACHAVSFASLHAQLPGLYGRDGLLPMAGLLRNVEQHVGGASAPLAARMRALPTLLWLHAPLHVPCDALAGAICLVGAALAGALACSAALRRRPGGLRSTLCLAALHVLFASVLAVGQTFLSFQWDALLLECTAVAALLALPRAPRLPPPLAWVPRVALFKLMLSSGAVKLQARCPTWSSLTALDFHFASQPLPTPLAWYAAALPVILRHLGVAATFVVEGPASWLLLCPLRGARHVGAALQVAFQVAIILTGNYTFFNALTIVLALACCSPPRASAPWRLERAASAAAVAAAALACAAMFEVGLPGARWDGLRVALTADDVTRALGVALPPTMQMLFSLALPAATLRGIYEVRHEATRTAGVLASAAGAVAMCALAAAPLASLLSDAPAAALRGTLPALPPALSSLAATARVSSSYGLFRAMTGVGDGGRVARPELLIQGRNASAATSGDADAGWHEIRFSYKPSAARVFDAPRWVAPHQPRLDWQMWFAALGPPGSAPWAVHLVSHILRGTPDVWALLAQAGDFSGSNPPAEVRVLRYELAFTQPGTPAAARGDWWVASRPTPWLQPLRQGSELDAWLASRGWAPPRGKRKRRMGYLDWARGGEAWAGVGAAVMGASAAFSLLQCAKQRDPPHAKDD